MGAVGGVAGDAGARIEDHFLAERLAELINAA